MAEKREPCHANRDGDCWWKKCPQILDGYCDKDGNPLVSDRKFRSCPLPHPLDMGDE